MAEDGRYQHPPQFAGRYLGCVLDDAGNCSRWNHDHPPAIAGDHDSEGMGNALEMSRRAEQAERRAEGAEAEVERLREVLSRVRWAFELQCPPMPAEKYVDRGAWMAHSWWNTVLGGILNHGGVTDGRV